MAVGTEILGAMDVGRRSLRSERLAGAKKSVVRMRRGRRVGGGVGRGGGPVVMTLSSGCSV